MDNKEHAVLTPILYADLFDFPLTEEEIWQRLPQSGIKTRSELLGILSRTALLSTKDKKYFYRKGRDILPAVRRKRELTSRLKIHQATEISRLLSRFPTVLLICISGSVAAHNAKQADDIDLFVVTKRNTIFITRFCLLLLLQFLGKRRGREEKKAENKICLNFILDEDAISFKKRADRYTAHELIQMIPLYERENMYTRVVRKNTWVKKFFPHSSAVYREKRLFITKRSTTVLIRLAQYFLSLLEWPMMSVQLWYIGRHQTTETVTKSLLAFHPVDYRRRTLFRFKKMNESYRN